MLSKVIRLSDLTESEVIHSLQNASLCFGHFNAIHPGHIRYFRTARKYNDQLIVGLEGDSQLSVRERKVVFTEVERAQALETLDIIDRVVILDTGRLEDLVELIKPNQLVLGKEFEVERAAKVRNAVNLVDEQGGRVSYEAGETQYATSSIFYGTRNELQMERWQTFHAALISQNIDLNKILDIVSREPVRRIMVVGDTIVDRYVACDPVGMSNEAPVIVVKELEARDYVGGAGIVSAHVSALGADCVYVSVTGEDGRANLVESQLDNYGVQTSIIKDRSRPTTFKTRYLVENQKLFRVSRLKEHSLSREIEDKVIERIEQLAPQLEGILVCDFVYGVITPRIIENLKRISKATGIRLFGDLQCSSQIGNVSKFLEFDLLCPTEREARIALGDQHNSVEHVANDLMEKTRSMNLILKLGSEGFIAYTKDSGLVRRQYFPALSVSPIDVAGAGDALLASVSFAMTCGLELMDACALGCCVSALAVQNVGNLPISLRDVRNLINTDGEGIANEI